MGPFMCALACFKTFTFVGATKMGSFGALFSLAGGGKGKEGKSADLQNGKVQNDDAEGGRVAPRRETTRALRARANGPKEGRIPEPGNPLVFSVRARRKGPAGDKIARFSPFGADGPVNKRNSQF